MLKSVSISKCKLCQTLATAQQLAKPNQCCEGHALEAHKIGLLAKTFWKGWMM
jgi:hypothetical protein